MGGQPEGTGTDAASGATGNRREALLDRAGALMATQGYDGTSMRDIAAAVGMLPGSLYYHFPSKEALFLALHSRVVAEMEARVRAALAGQDDPWDRLDAAAQAHLEGLLATGNLVAIVSPGFLDKRAEIGDEIRAERNRYERIFRDLFAALTLPAGLDRDLMRLVLFGALNWVPIWYDPRRGGDIGQIARQAILPLRMAAGALPPQGDLPR